MNKLTVNLLFTSAVLFISPLTFADCNDPDAYDDCITIEPDDNDSLGGSGSGGGGFVYSGGGGSSGGSQGVGSGNSGGS